MADIVIVIRNGTVDKIVTTGNTSTYFVLDNKKLTTRKSRKDPALVEDMKRLLPKET